MSDSPPNPNAGAILLAHYERITGSQAEFTRVSPAGASPGVFAAVHRGFPRAKAITGFTVGLSHTHSPATEGHPHRELVISMTDKDPAWALAAAFVAFQLQGRCGFDSGQTIDFREPIAPVSRMTAFVVVRPTILRVPDAEVDLGVRTVALRQLVPIYAEEHAWLTDGGDRELMLQRLSPEELMDPRRPIFRV